MNGLIKTRTPMMHIFEPKNIQNYFKFTIVRNPWDRLVSAFHFLKNGGFGQKDKEWFEQELGQYTDFNDFVKGWLNKENIWKWHHFRPQYNYMLDRRQKVKLDFIGFLENMDEDFKFIAKKLGKDIKLSKSNKSKHNAYTDYYNEETRDIVASVYAEDINLLGYDFENLNLENQLNRRNSGMSFNLDTKELKFAI